MTESEKVPGRGSEWTLRAVVFASLGVVIWIASFFRAREFGLYQDDYSRIPNIIGIGGSGLAARLWDGFTAATFGRPLSATLIDFFTFVGDRIGAPFGLYVIAFAIDTATAWMFYLVARRLFGSGVAALAAALAFALFPADTTRTWLASAFALQVSLLFVLAAIRVYLSGRRVVAYMLLVLTLLTYEAAFPVFAAVPLLGDRRERALRNELLENGAILGAMVGAAFVLRLVTRERRVAALDPIGAMETVGRNLIGGPLTSLGAYVLRPLQALAQPAPVEMLLVFASFLAMLGGLIYCWRRGRIVPNDGRRRLRIAFASGAMLVLGSASFSRTAARASVRAFTSARPSAPHS